MSFIDGPLTANPVTDEVEAGPNHAATTAQLPHGKRAPFLFSVKGLAAKDQDDEFKPGFTLSGEFDVTFLCMGGFVDPRGRGMHTGYDQIEPGKQELVTTKLTHQVDSGC